MELTVKELFNIRDICLEKDWFSKNNDCIIILNKDENLVAQRAKKNHYSHFYNISLNKDNEYIKINDKEESFFKEDKYVNAIIIDSNLKVDYLTKAYENQEGKTIYFNYYF